MREGCDGQTLEVVAKWVDVLRYRNCPRSNRNQTKTQTQTQTCLNSSTNLINALDTGIKQAAPALIGLGPITWLVNIESCSRQEYPLDPTLVSLEYLLRSPIALQLDQIAEQCPGENYRRPELALR